MSFCQRAEGVDPVVEGGDLFHYHGNPVSYRFPPAETGGCDGVAHRLGRLDRRRSKAGRSRSRTSSTGRRATSSRCLTRDAERHARMSADPRYVALPRDRGERSLGDLEEFLQRCEDEACRRELAAALQAAGLRDGLPRDAAAVPEGGGPVLPVQGAPGPGTFPGLAPGDGDPVSQARAGVTAGTLPFWDVPRLAPTDRLVQLPAARPREGVGRVGDPPADDRARGPARRRPARALRRPGPRRRRDAPPPGRSALEGGRLRGLSVRRRPPPSVYYEFEVNPLGALFDARVESPDGRRDTMRVDVSWNCPGFSARVAPSAGPLVGGL